MNEEHYQGEPVIDRTKSGLMINNGWKVLAAILLVLFLTSIGLNWKMSHKVDQIQQQMDQLQQIVSSQISSVGGQIGSITYNIDESMKKAQSIVADYGYQVQSEKIDRKNRTVPINLTVRPKEDKVGLMATFIIETEDGKTITVPGEKGEANTYVAAAIVPMVNYLKLSVTFDDGTTQKSEKLEDVYQPFDSMIMKVESIGSWSEISLSNEKIRYSGTVDTTITQSADGRNYPVKANIQVLKNGKLKKTIPIEIESAPESSSQAPQEAVAMAEMTGGTSATYFTQFNESFTLKDNDVLVIRVIVEDNYGFRYTQIIDSESISEDGSFNPTNYSGEVVIE